MYPYSSTLFSLSVVENEQAGAGQGGRARLARLNYFCSGRPVLALVRPVVPYTLALSSALLAAGVSGSALYIALLIHRTSRASYRRVALRHSESSAFLLKLEAIF